MTVRQTLLLRGEIFCFPTNKPQIGDVAHRHDASTVTFAGNVADDRHSRPRASDAYICLTLGATDRCKRDEPSHLLQRALALTKRRIPLAPRLPQGETPRPISIQ